MVVLLLSALLAVWISFAASTFGPLRSMSVAEYSATSEVLPARDFGNDWNGWMEIMDRDRERGDDDAALLTEGGCIPVTTSLITTVNESLESNIPLAQSAMEKEIANLQIPHRVAR